MPTGKITSLNGEAWPDACFDEESVHFFVIGDWGGMCNWVDNECKPNVTVNLGKGMPDGAPGLPIPMPNRPSNTYSALEPNVQRMVKDRMVTRTTELKAQGSAPKFIVNVGDNFYPGGVDAHCGAEPKNNQFEQIWDQFYPAKDLENMEWWSVLGNHDYGGVCYIKGWDKQIEFTWKNDRWVMPAQFWKRKVHFRGFTVDFWFLDGNVYDIMSSDPNHSPCTAASNPGRYCEVERFPPMPGSEAGSCPLTGPESPDVCRQWFIDLWNAQYDWLHEEVPKSDADWQIIVNHYPAIYNTGIAGRSFIEWSSWLDTMGIDLMISGHTHEQRVVYKDTYGGKHYETAFVISGGGGGVSSEIFPSDSGEDDAYGFMDMQISAAEIKITAYTHGGTDEKMIIRNQTTVHPNKKRPRAAAGEQVVV